MSIRFDVEAKLLHIFPEDGKISSFVAKHFREIKGNLGKELICDNLTLTWHLMREDWCPILEWPQFIWYFRVPLALHAQIRTARHWSFFSESHQLRDASAFYDNGDFYEPPAGMNGVCSEVENIHREALQESQIKYNELLKTGVLPSIARGVLPMHKRLGLYACCSLRSLFKMVVVRRCNIFQMSYWHPLLEVMEQEVWEKLHPDEREDRSILDMFKWQPCDLTGKCLSGVEQRLRDCGLDPHSICPRWKTIEKTNGEKTCCHSGCEGCFRHLKDQNIDLHLSQEGSIMYQSQEWKGMKNDDI